MLSTSNHLRPSAPQCLASCSRLRGFTLIEMVIVVLIIGVVAAVSVPRLMDTSTSAEVGVILQKVRVAHDAAERVYVSSGKFPGDVDRGLFPPDFKGYLAPNFFSQSAPGGGTWDWNGESTSSSLPIGLSIAAEKPNLTLWATIDAAHDDGNLNKGLIRMPRPTHLCFLLLPENSASKSGAANLASSKSTSVASPQFSQN